MFVRLGKLLLDGRTENIVDRLCYRWSPALLLTIVSATFVYWLIGSPIVCDTPDGFAEQRVKYAESLCWLSKDNYDEVKLKEFRFDADVAVHLDKVAATLREKLHGAHNKIAELSITLHEGDYEANFLGLTVNLNHSYITMKDKRLDEGNMKDRVELSDWTMTLYDVKIDFKSETIEWAKSGLFRHEEIPPVTPIRAKLNEDIAQVKKLNQKRYHLWLPFVLLVMASMFFLPHWAWHMYIAGSDVKLDNLSAVFREPRLAEETRRDDRCKVSPPRGCFSNKMRCVYATVISVVFPRHDITLIVAYTIVKILNLIIINLQISLLNNFLAEMDPRLSVWGLLDKLFHSKSMDSSDLFPTLVVCPYTIMNVTRNNQKYSLWCRLDTNHYNPVIVALVSYWINLLYTVILVDLIVWVLRLITAVLGTFLFAVCGGTGQPEKEKNPEMVQLTNNEQV